MDFFRGVSHEILKTLVALEKAFTDFFGNFFVADLPLQKKCLNTQEFNRVLSTDVVSVESRALSVLLNKVV